MSVIALGLLLGSTAAQAFNPATFTTVTQTMERTAGNPAPTPVVKNVYQIQLENQIQMVNLVLAKNTSLPQSFKSNLQYQMQLIMKASFNPAVQKAYPQASQKISGLLDVLPRPNLSVNSRTKIQLDIQTFALMMTRTAAQSPIVEPVVSQSFLSFPYAINPDVSGTRNDLIKVHSTIIPLTIKNIVQGRTGGSFNGVPPLYKLERCAPRTGQCELLKTGNLPYMQTASYTDTRFSGLVDPGVYQSNDWLTYQGRYGGSVPTVKVCVRSDLKVTDPKCPAVQTIKMPVSQYFVDRPLAQFEYRLTFDTGVVVKRSVNVYY